MPPPPSDARAFVVAGGRSSRMGRDKARLPYRESTLLTHALGLLREVTPDVAILCGPERRYEDFGAPLVIDAVCGVGPLGGLYSALLSASIDKRERIVWLGVDLPLVPPTTMDQLLRELERADVAMARTTRGVEPLCAAFRTAPTLESVRHALLDGRLKLTSALASLMVHTVDADDESFVNVNSPEEYERVK
jgi:molybdenum cofactor guanylyltransferase